MFGQISDRHSTSQSMHLAPTYLQIFWIVSARLTIRMLVQLRYSCCPTKQVSPTLGRGKKTFVSINRNVAQDVPPLRARVFRSQVCGDATQMPRVLGEPDSIVSPLLFRDNPQSHGNNNSGGINSPAVQRELDRPKLLVTIDGSHPWPPRSRCESV